MQPVERLAYTMAEAAEAIGVSRQYMYVLAERGEIRTVKIGRSRRVPRAELERLAKEGAT